MGVLSKQVRSVDLVTCWFLDCSFHFKLQVNFFGICAVNVFQGGNGYPSGHRVGKEEGRVGQSVCSRLQRGEWVSRASGGRFSECCTSDRPQGRDGYVGARG